jgi:cysteine desulfurase family protein
LLTLIATKLLGGNSKYMIYFDNAATTFPKPPQVITAMKKALNDYGGNPGRAGHSLSIKTAEAVFEARAKCADFFGAQIEHVIFTLNCTHALNMAIKGISSPGAHYIMSDIEHNATARPIHAISRVPQTTPSSAGVTYSVAKTFDDDDETVKSFESLITAKTKAVVCTAASNVTGKILPYKQLGQLCKKRGICFILDAAQGGGVIDIKAGENNGVNFICCSGHKGLYGPTGTGLLITDGVYKLRSFVEGGTGSNSRNLEQPDNLPDRFESGTINTPGVIALGAGIDFITKAGITRIYSHERELCELFMNNVCKIKKVKLYFDNLDGRTPLVPFNINGLESHETANLLSDTGICVRGGLHCSFLAHKKMNTLDTGAVRMAPSVFNTKKDVMGLIRQIEKIAGRI